MLIRDAAGTTQPQHAIFVRWRPYPIALEVPILAAH
jgi:hypothetical protein